MRNVALHRGDERVDAGARPDLDLVVLLIA
jgi:hypothetical protein